MIYTRFDDIPLLAYDVILADPPTDFETYSDKGHEKSQHAQYPIMTWDDLFALRVADLGRGDATLFLWACWPTLDRSIDMLKSWGFRYVTGGSWTKLTKNGKHRWGTGYRLRSVCEPYLIGTLGSPAQVTNVKNLIETEHLDVIRAENRGHSRKPEEQYEVCEKLMPHALRRLEMFARSTRPGWDAFGNEVGKFDEAQPEPAGPIGSMQLRRYIANRRSGMPTEHAAEAVGMGLAEARLWDADEAAGKLAWVRPIGSAADQISTRDIGGKAHA